MCRKLIRPTSKTMMLHEDDEEGNIRDDGSYGDVELEDSSSGEQIGIPEPSRPPRKTRSLPQLYSESFSASDQREQALNDLQGIREARDLHLAIQTGARNVIGEVRPLITLRRHYYPEGGWGWCVLTAALAVHVLAHGLHMAVGILMLNVFEKFKVGLFPQAGML